VIAPAEQTIAIAPVGDHFRDVYKPLSREIRRILGYHPEIIHLLDEINFAFNRERGQSHSTPVLEKLASMAPSHAIRIIALTKEDLFIPILTHVYGEAQLGGRAGIVSTFRLAENLSHLSREKNLHARIAKEAIHELGHTFNLLHCRERTCIMHYCRSIADVDKKSDNLCKYCRTLLEDEKKRLAGKVICMQ